MPRIRSEYAIITERDEEVELSAPRACWEDAGFPIKSAESLTTSTLRVPLIVLLNRLGQCGWEISHITGDRIILRRPESDSRVL